ncbi:OsmC family protein [Pseudomonas putida S11]|nr:OsmC family protein [Pseudomonas putida S11]
MGEAGFTPDRIDTAAEVTLDKQADGFAITAVHLVLRAKVPGASEAQFLQIADKAKAGCPVSKVLNAKISLDAALVG